MTKSLSSHQDLAITAAMAMHFQTTPLGTNTIGEGIGRLLREVREQLKNPLITTKQIMTVIEDWVSRGWAVVTKKYVQLTEAGKRQMAVIAATIV